MTVRRELEIIGQKMTELDAEKTEKILREMICETEARLRKAGFELAEMRAKANEAMLDRARTMEQVITLQAEVDQQRIRAENAESQLRLSCAEAKALHEQIRNLELALKHAESIINREHPSPELSNPGLK